MREELRLVNALVFMSQGVMDWPTALNDHGFVLTAVQRDVAVSLDGEARTVTPEAVFTSGEDSTALLVESKSNTFSDGQARRYLAVTGDDLKESGCLTAGADAPANVAPTYFCKSDCTEVLGAQVDHFNQMEAVRLPLVDYDHHRFKTTTDVDGHQRGAINHRGLDEAFAAGLYFREENWPECFLPFDADSNIHDMIHPLLGELTGLLVDPSIDEFTSGDVMGGPDDSAAPGVLLYWDQLGAQAQTHLLDRATEIIEEFRRHYISRYLDRVAGQQRWRKRVEAADHPAQYRLVRESGLDYLNRKLAGLPLPQAAAGDQHQLDLNRGEHP